MKYFLLGLLAWFLYNLVFRLIIPAYRTTKRVRSQFAEMQERMQQKTQEFQNQQAKSQEKATQQAQPKANSQDYIDFEEVK